MGDWLPGFLKDWHLSWSTALWALFAFVGTSAVSTAAVAAVLVRLPADYFRKTGRSDPWAGRNRLLRWAFLIGKNLLGAVLVLGGVVLSLPGVPGPGLVLILVGVSLLSFPGKRRLEQKLVSRPGVFRTVNRLRTWFGKPPLVLDDGPGGHGGGLDN